MITLTYFYLSTIGNNDCRKIELTLFPVEYKLMIILCPQMCRSIISASYTTKVLQWVIFRFKQHLMLTVTIGLYTIELTWIYIGEW